MGRRRANGFSMVELMITIAIVAILVAIAFPSFENTMRSNRLAGATNEMIATFSLARAEGLRNPEGAVICTSEDGTSCGGDWDDGWIVWIDVNGDGTIDTATDRILRYVQGLNQVAISASSSGDLDAAKRIIFDNRGRVDTHTRTIVLQPETCTAGSPYRRTLQVSLTGQVKMTRGNCA